MEPVAASKGIEIRLETPNVGVPSVFGDQQRMRQVMLNLVSNAVKFTCHGFVRIGLSSSSRRHRIALQIDVEDTGIGIPEDKQADVFEPFVQVGDQSETSIRGTGLGLALCQRRARKRGWKRNDLFRASRA